MRTVSDIYREYRIMPSLALHQLRVAAVAETVCDRCSQAVDASTAVTACLFHDMGNIIKSELSYFPEFLEPEGLTYWEGVKAEFIQKYGSNEHEATLAIADELGLPRAVRDVVEKIGFSKLEEVEQSGSTETMICEYADMRVGPLGVLSMADRLEEGRIRYSNKKDKLLFDPQFYDRLSDALYRIEARLFSGASIRPEDITDSGIEPLIGALRSKEL